MRLLGDLAINPCGPSLMEGHASSCEADAMSRLARLLAGLLVAVSSLWTGAEAASSTPATPTAILAAAPAADWVALDPADLLVVDLQGGARVVIALADTFAPVHVANIRQLAHEQWYDGLAVERVQDAYVTQWGDPDGKKRLPGDVVQTPPAEYERPAAGLQLHPLPYRDTYAPEVGVVSVFPVARQGGSAWLTHCYGMVGVGRDLNPDTGSGAELYVVIGQPIRALDRNIALVGRVVGGMEALSSLPRGTGDLGFYTEAGSDLPAAEQPHLQRLRPDSPTYRAWVQARANRQDSFFLRPAGAVDVCSALPPVRSQPQ